jgi:hypothetical protein
MRIYSAHGCALRNRKTLRIVTVVLSYWNFLMFGAMMP